MWFIELLKNKAVRVALWVLLGLVFVPFTIMKVLNYLRGLKYTTQPDAVKNTALKLSIHLGTNKDLPYWYTWTEDDEEVKNILIGLSSSEFTAASQAYKYRYTKSKDLRADVLRLLDSQYLKEIPYL